MSSRSPSSTSSEPRNRDKRDRSSRDEHRSSINERTHHSVRREGDSVSPPPDVGHHTSECGSISPGLSVKSDSHSKKHSGSSPHSNKYLHTRSKSPALSRKHDRSTSRSSRSKSPKGKRDQSSSSRRSRSGSRSESPPHGRRLHSKKSRSRSPPSHKRRDYRRSRSRSPSHRREYSRRSRSRSKSRSRSPDYNKGSRSYDYKQYRSRYSGNKRGFQDKKFHKGREGQYYRKTATCTPIAKEPTRDMSTSTPGTSSLLPGAQPAVSPSDLEKLTPEQKLERALLAAQALTPKMNVPQPSISALSTTAASAVMNPLLRNPAASQKKKLVWNKKSSSNYKWEGVSLGEDGDEEAQAKFRRLMGMGKNPSPQSSSQTPATASGGDTLKEKHEKLRKDLEQQYETSRYMTHLARGSGLGFGFSSSYDSSS